jgi:uncharacterized membrane protein
VIYFSGVFGSAAIIQICLLILYKTDMYFQVNLLFSINIALEIFKLVSIIIIIATAIIVVNKRCNKTLREHDDGRASRGTSVDKSD